MLYADSGFRHLCTQGNHPAVNIDWFAAIDYCNWLNKQWGYPPVISKSPNGEAKINFNASAYRLPAEAEWEFAARGGIAATPFRYAGSDVLKEVAWCRDNSLKTTHPVGKMAPNSLGFYDMSGNVDEWCWDAYSQNNFKTMDITPEKGSRIVRGGHFQSDPFFSELNATDRQNVDNAKEFIGFRAVLGTDSGIPQFKFISKVAADSVVVATRFERKLPNNQIIVGNIGGLENQLIPFIEVDSIKVNKTSWFICDGIFIKPRANTIDVAQSQKQLRNLVHILNAFPKAKLKIGGYTDSDGEEAANVKISEEFANSAMQALISMGVPEEKLRAEGYGEQYPICQANDTPECKAKNRRISIRVSDK